MTGPTCDQCGAPDCRPLFDHLLALEFDRPDPYGRLHAVTVAAWFLQHPEPAPAGSRGDHWAILHEWRRDGLPAVHELARRRRLANRHGGDLPPAREPPAPVPERVSTAVTIVDVAGPVRDFPREGHEARVAAWIDAILGPG